MNTHPHLLHLTALGPELFLNALRHFVLDGRAPSFVAICKDQIYKPDERFDSEEEEFNALRVSFVTPAREGHLPILVTYEHAAHSADEAENADLAADTREIEAGLAAQNIPVLVALLGAD